MEEKNIKKEILWEHLTEKLGRKLNAHETYIFHEIIDLLDTRALTAAPVATNEALEALSDLIIMAKNRPTLVENWSHESISDRAEIIRKALTAAPVATNEALEALSDLIIMAKNRPTLVENWSHESISDRAEIIRKALTAAPVATNEALEALSDLIIMAKNRPTLVENWSHESISDRAEIIRKALTAALVAEGESCVNCGQNFSKHRVVDNACPTFIDGQVFALTAAKRDMQTDADTVITPSGGLASMEYINHQLGKARSKYLLPVAEGAPKNERDAFTMLDIKNGLGVYGTSEAISLVRKLVKQASALVAEGVDIREDHAFLPIPRDLHPATAQAVVHFALKLAVKLKRAQDKYGYSNGWMQDDWMDECRQKLVEHIAKGDPVDVAAYCMFLDFHREPTALTPPAQGNIHSFPNDNKVYGIFDGKYIGMAQRVERADGTKAISAWPDYGDLAPSDTRWTWFNLPYPHNSDAENYTKAKDGIVTVKAGETVNMFKKDGEMFSRKVASTPKHNDMCIGGDKGPCNCGAELASSETPSHLTQPDLCQADSTKVEKPAEYNLDTEEQGVMRTALRKSVRPASTPAVGVADIKRKAIFELCKGEQMAAIVWTEKVIDFLHTQGHLKTKKGNEG